MMETARTDDGDDQQGHEEQLRRQADEARAPRFRCHPVCHPPDRRRQHGDHQCRKQADEPDSDQRRDKVDRPAERIANGIPEPVPVAPRADVDEGAERRPANPDLVDLPVDHRAVGALDAPADGGHIAAHVRLGSEADRAPYRHDIAVDSPVDPGRPQNRHDIVADGLVFGHGHIAAQAHTCAAMAVAGHLGPPPGVGGRRGGRCGRRRGRNRLRGRSRRRLRHAGEERSPAGGVEERQLRHQVGVFTQPVAQFPARERRPVDHDLPFVDVDGPDAGPFGLRDEEDAAADLDHLEAPLGPFTQLLQLGPRSRTGLRRDAGLGDRGCRAHPGGGNRQKREGDDACAHVSSPAGPSACAARRTRIRRRPDSTPVTRSGPVPAADARRRPRHRPARSTRRGRRTPMPGRRR